MESVTVDWQQIWTEAYEDPDFEAAELTKRPLRGMQGEIIKRVEAHVRAHEGGVMVIRSSRQTGKNETAANLQRRHLCFKRFSHHIAKWIRTAPTHVPQIVNSKKRLEELMSIDAKSKIGHPLFLGERLQRTEGYIWRVGNATVEFMSSGPHSNVVGATASECLDMDEAHKISKDKFDEDFAPFTASTNAATLLWGVAADGLDTMEWYRNSNIENGREDLNLDYPAEMWAEVNRYFRLHYEGRVKALGLDHPIIKTQYRLIPVANEGTFINGPQARKLLSGEHERRKAPRPGARYEVLIDLAGANEDFNPESNFVGESETATDSTVIWVYEVTDEICDNKLFPICLLTDLEWWTGVDLTKQEEELKRLIRFWGAQKVTVDGVGIGRQIADALVNEFGAYEEGGTVNCYLGNSTSVSEDCFDLLARLNYAAVKMFQNDSSPEYEEFVKQVGWTKYSSSAGRMTLMKPPGGTKHIDMVKGLTYFNRNNPSSAIHQILSVDSKY